MASVDPEGVLTRSQLALRGKTVPSIPVTVERHKTLLREGRLTATQSREEEEAKLAEDVLAQEEALGTHASFTGDKDEDPQPGIIPAGIASGEQSVVVGSSYTPPVVSANYTERPISVYDHGSGRTFSNGPPIVSSTLNLHDSDRGFNTHLLKVPSVLDPLGGVSRLRFERGEITTCSNFFDVKNRDLQFQVHIPGLASSGPDILTQQRLPARVGEQVTGITPWINHETQHSFPLSNARNISGHGKLRHTFYHFCLVLTSLNNHLQKHNRVISQWM